MCGSCQRLCRERDAPYGEGGSFADHLAATQSLDELRLPRAFPDPGQLPAFIPLDTHDLRPDAQWMSAVGVRLKYLFTSRASSSFRESIGVSADAPLFGVLHGTDNQLELFWGRKGRAACLRRLQQHGYYGITGPTFSVVYEVTERLPVHNEISLRRHNRVVQEIADAGLVPIPNLYTTGEHGLAMLGAWLREQPAIRLVTRDLSMTKKGAPFHAEVEKLRQLLVLASRPLHVLLLGISLRNAAYILRIVQEAGSSASVLSQEPILKAQKGQRLVINEHGSGRYVKDTSSRAGLASYNLRAAASLYEEIAAAVNSHMTSRPRVRQIGVRQLPQSAAGPSRLNRSSPA